MKHILAAVAAGATLAVAGCGSAPPAGPVLSASAGRACLAPIERWETDPALRDVTLIQDAGGVVLKACIASDRPGPLALVRADVTLMPKDGRPRCGTPDAPAHCTVGDLRTNVGATAAPMPLMPRTVAVLSRARPPLPADFGPVQPGTTAVVTWAPCLDAACAAAGPAVSAVVPVTATVIQK